MDETSKQCWRCLTTFQAPLDLHFYRKGRDTACKTCRHALNAAWARAHRAERREAHTRYMRFWRAKRGAKKKVDKLRKYIDSARAASLGVTGDDD
jgi:hypothetical protein